MERFSGAEWDLEHVEPEPMGHEWGDHTTFDGSYDPFPFEGRSGHLAAVAQASSSVAPISVADPLAADSVTDARLVVEADAADPTFDDFGGGSQDVDPADACSDETIEAAEPSSAEMLPDPEAEVALLEMAEVDPFDAFDEEFALVVEELEVELPGVEEMVEG